MKEELQSDNLGTWNSKTQVSNTKQIESYTKNFVQKDEIAVISAIALSSENMSSKEHGFPKTSTLGPSIAMGCGKAIGDCSFAMHGTAAAKGSVVIGTRGSYISENCAYSHAEGNSCSCLNEAKNCHVEGVQNKIEAGQGNHAEGIRNMISASLNQEGGSHAEGEENKIYGIFSHAEGYLNIISSKYSHAEGSTNEIYGNNSHAEGGQNKIFSKYSHAEGHSNNVSSDYSHAEGFQCIVGLSAAYAHAQGYSTKAMAKGTVALGARATATGEFSFAWNGDPNKTYDPSKGHGTFCVNPMNDISGFYIGGTSLKELLDRYGSDYTAFEVFPTDRSIPAGTNDTKDDLKALFGWSEEVASKFNYTNQQYTVDVLSCKQLKFTTQLNNIDSVYVDFGDGSEVMSIAALSARGIASGQSNKLSVTYEYSNPGKYIVKIYGNAYRLIGNSTNNLISRVFDNDLPICEKFYNAASMCKGSLRLLKVDVPNAWKWNSGMSFFECFKDCSNLKSFKNGKRLMEDVLTISGIFYNCTNIIDIRWQVDLIGGLPLTKDGQYENVYRGCTNLATPLYQLLPINGYTTGGGSNIGVGWSASCWGRKINDISHMFDGCKSIPRIDEDLPPAFKAMPNLKTNKERQMTEMLLVEEALWNSPNYEFIRYSNVFTGCDLISEQVPATWQVPN